MEIPFGNPWDWVRNHIGMNNSSGTEPNEPDGAAINSAKTIQEIGIPLSVASRTLAPNQNPADPDYGSAGLPSPRIPHNQCEPGSDACILPGYGFGSMTPDIGYNDSFSHLGKTEQNGVMEHEKSHQRFHQMWFDNNFGWLQKLFAPLPGSDVRRAYDRYDATADEIAAYQAEADYLESYMNSHPNDPNYSGLQQRWLDRWRKIDDYKNGRLK
jgi:hypothetical protein